MRGVSSPVIVAFVGGTSHDGLREVESDARRSGRRGISEQTFCIWKMKHGHLTTPVTPSSKTLNLK
jgi:hypothetical protein